MTEPETVVRAGDIEMAIVEARFAEKLDDGSLKLTPEGSLALGMLLSTIEVHDTTIYAVAAAARKVVGRIVCTDVRSAYLPPN